MRLSHLGATLLDVTLKDHLDDPKSQLRGFFNEHLPNTKAMRALLKQSLSGPVTFAPPPEPRPYPFTEVGHAFGVRAMWFFSREVPRMSAPVTFGQLTHECVDAFSGELHQLLDRLSPDLDRPTPEGEALLCRHAYVLGLVDQLHRAGPRDEMPLLQLPATAAPGDLLALAPPECVDDLCALVSAAYEPLRSLPREPVIIGPVFAGSVDVSGADADLIVGPCLVEVKTTVDINLRQRTLQQTVAYALLDYDDKYGITEVVVYSSRQAGFARVRLQDAVDSMGATIDVAQLRSVLADWMQGDWPRIAENQGQFKPCGFCHKVAVFVPLDPELVQSATARCRECGKRNTVLWAL